jgi:hypothetical protein
VRSAYDRLESGFWNISKVKENRMWQIKELYAVLTFLRLPLSSDGLMHSHCWKR